MDVALAAGRGVDVCFETELGADDEDSVVALVKERGGAVAVPDIGAGRLLAAPVGQVGCSVDGLHAQVCGPGDVEAEDEVVGRGHDERGALTCGGCGAAVVGCEEDGARSEGVAGSGDCEVWRVQG